MDFSQLKYFEKRKKSTTYVSYSILDKEGTKLRTYNSTACYSNISYGSLESNCHSISTWIAEYKVPYSLSTVEKWVELMNQMGFPVTFEGISSNNFFFKIVISDYKYKVHFNSAFMVLRYLWESGLNRIPEITLRLVEEHPDVDPFKLLQLAHVYMGSAPSFTGNVYATGNTNHAIRDFFNHPILSREEFFDKLEKHKDNNPYESKKHWVSSIWTPFGMGSTGRPGKEDSEEVKTLSDEKEILKLINK